MGANKEASLYFVFYDGVWQAEDKTAPPGFPIQFLCFILLSPFTFFCCQCTPTCFTMHPQILLLPPPGCLHQPLHMDTSLAARARWL